MPEPPGEWRITRHVATRKETPDSDTVRRAAREKAIHSRMWKVDYGCGSVRFMPAQYSHELSSECPQHGTTSECNYSGIRLTQTEWRLWRERIGTNRNFTKEGYERVLRRDPESLPTSSSNDPDPDSSNDEPWTT